MNWASSVSPHIVTVTYLCAVTLCLLAARWFPGDQVQPVKRNVTLCYTHEQSRLRPVGETIICLSASRFDHWSLHLCAATRDAGPLCTLLHNMDGAPQSGTHATSGTQCSAFT